ncbi:MAG: hypothetical protein QOD81_685 [Solirubrobacteraceae bacterium]|jgi:hypothetical protein|nr:hypothetical protein [Solirubrobacteraceae bacterium]MEA2267451.1 hypothetical protein [Solirubrobacteraceae bacterium]MEA2320835.1 hypothetical protein [Solirubrobacteraceae bacterium]
MKSAAVAGIIVVGGVAAAVASQLPEIRRYLTIRNM